MSDLIAAAESAATPRSKRFKAMTGRLHEALDKRMTDADLFANRERYALFLAMQRRFHAEIAPLYRGAALSAMGPDLPERAKLEEIDRDIADLGAARPEPTAAAVDPSDAAAALGWLYVAEGSSLGAAFLYKAAERLGLDDGFGARHLAAHPEGRGLHWRRFVEALDAVELSEEEEDRAAAAAVAAFVRVREIAEETLASGEAQRPIR